MLDFAKRKICANQLTNIMKGIAALAPTLLLTLILTSCMSDGYTDTAAGKSDTYINLNVSTPTAQAKANAPAGSTAGTSGTLKENETSPDPIDEGKIYSIRVWAFKSGTDENAMPIGFKAETGLNKTGSHQVSMKLLRKAAGDLENIDLFILLNAESIRVLDGNNCNTMTRKALKDTTFNSNFGINTDDGSPQATTVPATGLPISRVITNINVKDNIADNAAAAADNPVSVPLVRAVSKLHFFFARKTGKDTESVTVTRIEVNGETLTEASPVFPEAATNAEKDTKGLTGSFNDLNYLNKNLIFGGIATDQIKPVDDPKKYIRQPGEKAQDYMTRLSTDDVQEGCRSYLRETDKPITGKIYFKSNASLPDRWVEFQIPEAYRNHELVVYGYFSGEAFLNNLELQYYVADWNVKDATNITFK